ncbi:glycoside hydrolase family 66 protein [Paenibacillus thermotolerans]|uniref:glycoside hydrolase family 66 protein n=1 Tax=Paenibacillus thermotolerans TaxID=3027807 RepID=UPI0023681E1E|nr:MULTISPECIES: glycoside hydrolase family 66 protein [unclassified Paenibacillus]
MSVRAFFTTMALVLLVVSAWGASQPEALALGASEQSGVIAEVALDKAMYRPGEPVRIEVRFANRSGVNIWNGTVTVSFKHLDREAGPRQTSYYTVNAGETAVVSFVWSPPSDDYRGYMIEAEASDRFGNVTGRMNTAADVSSTWTKFPRYGFQSDFASRDSVSTVKRLELLKAFHINALQYYGSEGGEADAQTVADTLRTAKSFNMANLSYSAMNSAARGYEQDGGIDPRWGLYKRSNGTNQLSVQDSRTGQTLAFFHPADIGWQTYKLARERQLLSARGFDGWHADTFGNPGAVYTYSGEQANVKQSYADFVNSAKRAMGGAVVMNNYGGYGLEETAASQADLLFVELWESYGQSGYQDIKELVDRAMKAANGMKPVVLAGYMNYRHQLKYTEQSPGEFNLHGVLRADAAMFASGAAHFELGDDLRMLHSEIVPRRFLTMSDELKSKLKSYYDFLVAYENLLRDGQQHSAGKVAVGGVPYSPAAAPDTVWTFAKTGYGRDIIHFINLLGVSSKSWRDSNADQPAPQIKRNIPVKYYYGAGSIRSVQFASPDVAGGSSKPLAFSEGTDSSGKYVTFTIPSLEYWDMVYIEKADETGLSVDRAGKLL